MQMENADASTPQPVHTEADPVSAQPDPSSSAEQYSRYDDDDNDDNLPVSIIRLIQCPSCAQPLRTPLRLPCGNALCRNCLPPTHPRRGITYPVAEGRGEGFTCRWRDSEGCGGEHCVGDCGVDVVLGKVMELFEGVLVPSELVRNDHDGLVVCWREDESMEMIKASLGCSGRLEGLYRLAHEGRFPLGAFDVVCQGPTHGKAVEKDRIALQALKDSLRAELDCQVCYALILDPLTTPCGHTFCRKCIARILDNTDLCPVCRRKLGLPPAIQSEPVNHTLAHIIEYLFADQVTARREAIAQDELVIDHEENLPLFVCTLSFPTMPTFLHIFETRYRLMIRRVVDGDGKFGMVMYNRHVREQEELGNVPFTRYGTLLMVERYELLSDGRSLVIATGVSRFKVVESRMLDGYYVARTERVDDISLAEEERLEAMETSAALNPEPAQEGRAATGPVLDAMSTQDLLSLGQEFINRQRQAGAPWLHPRVMLAYGPAPADAAQFPWWLASILPMKEEEKYPILSVTSVRERLKITARWARELEARARYVSCLPQAVVMNNPCPQVQSLVDEVVLMTTRPSAGLLHHPSGVVLLVHLAVSKCSHIPHAVLLLDIRLVWWLGACVVRTSPASSRRRPFFAGL